MKNINLKLQLNIQLRETIYEQWNRETRLYVGKCVRCLPFIFCFLLLILSLLLLLLFWILATEVLLHELALTLSEVVESYHSRRIELKED